MGILPAGRCRSYTERTKLRASIGAIPRRCAPGGSARHSHEHGKAGNLQYTLGKFFLREIFYEELK
jgi:hypothetical protein